MSSLFGDEDLMLVVEDLMAELYKIALLFVGSAFAFFIVFILFNTSKFDRRTQKASACTLKAYQLLQSSTY